MEIPKPSEDDKQFFRSILPEDPEVGVKPTRRNQPRTAWLPGSAGGAG